MGKIKTTIVVVLILMVVAQFLTSCTTEPVEYRDESTTKLDETTTVNKVEEVVEHRITEEYIINCLKKIEGIDEVEAVTEDNDPNGRLNKEGHYISQIFFSSSYLDQGEIFGNDLIDKGTDAGGSVEIYRNESDAQKRDKYLAEFDDSLFLNSGSHICVGTVVVRTSKELPKEKQKEIENEIIALITNNKTEADSKETKTISTTTKSTTSKKLTETKKNDHEFYSSNDYETAKKGSTGSFAYIKEGLEYDVYWIIDFDDGYAYSFTDGQGDDNCDKIRIKSGNLNNRMTITYCDGGHTWSYGLFFKYKNAPSILTLQDNDGFLIDYYATNLKNALAIRETKNIRDCSE